jgi:quinol monooxygenase YgiN
MSTLLAKIKIHPGKENTFEAVMQTMYQATHSTEDQVIRYEYWRGCEPGFYYCLLSFATTVDFWRHQASDHHEGEMQRFVDCIAELDLETVDPVQGASPLPATQEGTLDRGASLQLADQAEQFPVSLAQWWLAHRS